MQEISVPLRRFSVSATNAEQTIWEYNGKTADWKME